MLKNEGVLPLNRRQLQRVAVIGPNAEQGQIQCRYGCDSCTSSCPHGVAIPEVLRTRMYAEDYGDTDLARADYARLARAGSQACLHCSGKPCASACPFGIPIAALTRRTHLRMRV